MKTERGSALPALLALVTVIALVEGGLLLQLSGRVGDLEQRAGAVDPAPATPLALAEEVHRLEERVKEQAARVKDLESGAKERGQQLAEVRATLPVATGLPAAAASPAGPTVPREALEEAVAKAVDERMEALPRGGGGEWKPSLDEFGEELGLTEEQVTAAERVFDDAKHETYRLLSIPRDDGTNKLDDLVAALGSEEAPEEAVKQVFASLFTEKIPGRDEPYLVEVLRIKQTAQKGLEGILTQDQTKRLSRLNLDHLGVQTAYDPFAEYVRESMR